MGAHETTLNYEGIDLTLIVHDTQGQPEYLAATRSEYPGTRVFMVCFDINRVVQDNLNGGWADMAGALRYWLSDPTFLVSLHSSGLRT